MKLRALLASSSLLLVMVACSGASSTELFGPADTSQLGTEPAGSSGDGSSGAASSGGSSGEPSSSSGSSGTSSSSSSSSSGGSSSGNVDDAGVDAPPPPKDEGTIRCGVGPNATSCTAGTQICCGQWAGRGNLKYSCEPAGLLACVAGTTIACDDMTDCPSGQVCCGTQDNSRYTKVECKTKCTSFPGTRAVRFCDPDAAVDECAADGAYCGPSQTLPGYFVCRN